MRTGVLVVAILTVLVTADGTGVPGATCEPAAAHDCTSSGTVRWWLALDGQQPRPGQGSPTVAMEGGDLVFYVECDVVRALDRRSGRIRWKDTGVGALGCGSDHRLAYGDGLLVETEQWSPWKSQGAGRTTVLDAATGVRLSTYDRVDDPVAVVGGAVIFAADRLTAFDGRTGRARWSIASPTPSDALVPCKRIATFSPPPTSCPDAGVLYIADLLPALDQPVAVPADRERRPPARGPIIHRIDLRRGVALPDLAVNLETGGSPSPRVLAYAPSGVLVLLDRSGYRAIDSVTGQQLWSSPAPKSGAGVPGVDYGGDELIYLIGPQAIEAREARTGHLRWTAAPVLRKLSYLFEEALGSQVIGGVDDVSHEIFEGLDARTGAVRWSVRMGPDPAIPFGGDTVFHLAAGQPPLLVGVVCSPAGSHQGQPCVSRRLVAVNW